MRKIICGTVLCTSITLAGMAHAAETARMSANTIRQATVSTQSSGPASARPEIVVWILLAIFFIAALAMTGGSSGAMMSHYYVASDEALKTDIKRVGTSEQGFGIYEFRYKGQPQRLRGAMAQDVMRLRPEAVRRHENGYLMVDYGQIDVRPALID
ncbi:tail fiber domain-containing protein [Roseovarius ramblicola]|uniref:Tail fiber domain-containing protein n=1 Tax=Roseovarius ramblicola TaxID=2022336 RepID=A0ABV5HYX6_9RHOB